MERLKPIELLAREICWAGFSAPARAGKTKAAYWETVSPLAKERYRKDAEFVAWLFRKLGHQKLIGFIERMK